MVKMGVKFLQTNFLKLKVSENFLMDTRTKKRKEKVRLHSEAKGRV